MTAAAGPGRLRPHPARHPDHLHRLNPRRGYSGSDGRADRRGATVISIGAAGVPALRITEHGGKRQEETFGDLIAAAGIILGQRGRCPVAVLRGINYTASDEGVAAMLHHRP